MPRLKKKIVSQGVYEVPDASRPGIDPTTGLPYMRLEVVTPQRIRHWATEGTRYLKSVPEGIPAPWTHIDPVTGRPVVLSDNGTLPRADINGGWWKELGVEVDPVEGATLVGYVDVEGDENDPNTPAGKVGKTVKETSIFAAPKWKAGGQVFEDVPLHIAMVTHPIQPGQKNFEQVPADYAKQGFQALAMSNMSYSLRMANNPPASVPEGGQSQGGGTNGQQKQPGSPNSQPNQGMPNNASSADIGKVVAILKQCGLVLPDDTTFENLPERLIIAAGQKAASEGSATDNLYQAPGGAETKQPAPVAMSQTPTPITNENFANVTKEVLMSHPVVKQLVEANNALLTLTTEQARAALQSRITKLVGEGKLTQKYADDVLAPLITGFQMSFNGSKSPVELTILALESQPAPARPANQSISPSLLLGTAMSHPMAGPGNASDNPYIQAADPTSGFGVGSDGKPLGANDIINQFCQTTGMP